MIAMLPELHGRNSSWTRSSPLLTGYPRYYVPTLPFLSESMDRDKHLREGLPEAGDPHCISEVCCVNGVKCLSNVLSFGINLS
jgi:hypothetical protein